jgi:hypothetical protein
MLFMAELLEKGNSSLSLWVIEALIGKPETLLTETIAFNRFD